MRETPAFEQKDSLAEASKSTVVDVSVIQG